MKFNRPQSRLGLFIFNIIRSIRPRQWIKNITVAAALVFSGNLFDSHKLLLTIQAIIIFCGISSTIYLINDILDRESDQQHPFKRLRPIAAGEITVRQALITAIILGTISIIWAANTSFFFLLSVLSYASLQVFYSFKLKHISIIDLFAIALGFIIRIYGGIIIIDAHMSIWFLLCVISTALLIAAGKRRAELAILTDHQAAQHRKVLSRYPPEVLNSYVTMFANAAFLSWALFTFFAPPPELSKEYPGIFANLPSALAGHNKWLMITIPIVIYGIMRYLRLIYDGSKAESPERILVTDRPLLTTAIVWALVVIIILYLPGLNNLSSEF